MGVEPGKAQPSDNPDPITEPRRQDPGAIKELLGTRAMSDRGTKGLPIGAPKVPSRTSKFTPGNLGCMEHSCVAPFAPITAGPEPASAEPVGGNSVPHHSCRFVEQLSTSLCYPFENVRFFATEKAIPNPSQVGSEPTNTLEPLRAKTEIQSVQLVRSGGTSQGTAVHFCQ
jgi:hypothetical protein